MHSHIAMLKGEVLTKKVEYNFLATFLAFKKPFFERKLTILSSMLSRTYYMYITKNIHYIIKMLNHNLGPDLDFKLNIIHALFIVIILKL